MKIKSIVVALSLGLSFNVLAKEGDIFIQLSKNINSQELSELSNSYNMDVKEIFFSSGNIVGGYTLSNNESLEDAVFNLNMKHEEFLRNASDIEFSENGKDSQLGKLFSDHLNKHYEHDLQVDRIKIKGENSIPLILNSELILEIKPERNNQIKESNVSNLSSSLSNDNWAPYRGTSKVNQSFTYQTFDFNSYNLSNLKTDLTVTYEHETQVYDANYADYDGYWSSTMPNAYLDTDFGDSSSLDNFTIGSSNASSFEENKKYYTYMSLKAGTSNEEAYVRIKGQKGHRFPSSCYSTWCIWADATSESLTKGYTPNPRHYPPLIAGQ